MLTAQRWIQTHMTLTYFIITLYDKKSLKLLNVKIVTVNVDLPVTYLLKIFVFLM